MCSTITAERHKVMREDTDELIPTRSSLLSRLKQWDDQESWREFFNTYWRLIYRTAIKAGLSDAEAQDVVQETVIRVADKMRDFSYDREVDSFKGWLLYMTRKHIALQYRKRQRERGGDGHHPEVIALDDAIEQLPDPARADLEAAWDEEWERNPAGCRARSRQAAGQPQAIPDLQLLCAQAVAGGRGG